MIKTVSLETAKALKEAGFPQATELYYWSSKANDDRATLSRHWDLQVNEDLRMVIAAPTAEEILEQLPNRVKGKQLTITKYTGKLKYVIEYEDGMFEATLAEAAGKMWLFLK